MNLLIKYDMPTACKKILQEQLDKLDLRYTLKSFNEVEIQEPCSAEMLQQLSLGLNSYGLEIVENLKNVLVQKIKDAITEMIYIEDKLPNTTISAHLATKLNHSYGYLANVFSEITYTSIENYIILQKIEHAKQLIVNSQLTISEITWKLNYSSVAHFCKQFKNVTGITPSVFQRIINKKRASA